MAFKRLNDDVAFFPKLLAVCKVLKLTAAALFVHGARRCHPVLRRFADFLNASLRKLRLDLCGMHNNLFTRKRAGHEDDFFLK